MKPTRGIPHYVAALLGALRFREAEPDALRTLDDSEWNRLLPFCDLAHLTLQLSELRRDLLPGWVERRIVQNVSDNARRFANISTAYKELAEALEQAGAEHLVIKGFAQYPGYVASPLLRMQSDIDLFCPEGSMERAYGALIRIGYEPDRTLEHVAADHRPTMVRKGNWEWRGNAFDPEMPPSVELHFCLWNENNERFAIAGVKQFWNRRVTREVGGLTFPGLDPVDNLAYCALHVLRNLFRGDWILRQVYEIASFLHANANNTDLWSRWKDQHDDRLRSLEAISFRLASEWFGCYLSPEIEAEVDSLPASIRQWFRSFSNSPLVGMFHPNKDEVWLHRSLLASARDKRQVLRRSLVPARLPRLSSPGQDLTKFRTVREFTFSQRHVRYLQYIASRTGYHTRTLLPACVGGLKWWLSQRRLGRQFWTFFAASALFDLGFSIFFFLFNFYLLDRGFNEKSLGLVTSAMSVGGIASTIPAGIFAQRFGLKKALFVCFTMATLASCLRALAGSYVLQLLLAFLAGSALSMWAVCIAPMLAHVTDEDTRPFAFSLVFSVGIGLGALGSIIGGNLPGRLGWIVPFFHAADRTRIALLISCGIVALGLWPLSRLRVRHPPVGDVPPVEWRKRYRLHPFMLRFLPAIALWTIAAAAFPPFANVYFARHLHMPIPRIGAVFSVGQLMQVVAVLLSPLVFKKLGLIPAIVSTQIATAIALGCLALTRDPWLATLVYPVYAAVQWMCEPGMYSLLMSSVPEAERSGASALNVLVMSSVQAAAAAVAGISLSRFGYPAVLFVLAGIVVLAAGTFHRLLGRTPSRSSMVEQQCGAQQV